MHLFKSENDKVLYLTRYALQMWVFKELQTLPVQFIQEQVLVMFPRFRECCHVKLWQNLNFNVIKSFKFDLNVQFKFVV